MEEKLIAYRAKTQNNKAANVAAGAEDERQKDFLREKSPNWRAFVVDNVASVSLWKFVVWFCLWGFFVSIEFGAVYLVASGFLLLCVNLGNRSRKSGEMSAYSVFNKNCEAIDGTLTAEQFEREIRLGPSSVR